MASKPIPFTQEYLKSILDYDPLTGVFVWKVRLWRGQAGPGEVAGCNADGYTRIGINGENYFAAPLAYFWMTGVKPTETVDHRNRVRNDDRWENLRIATWVENNRNRNISKRNKSGTIGVSFDKTRGKWTVRIRVGPSYLFIGRFALKDDAIAARKAAETKYFGEFAPA